MPFISSLFHLKFLRFFIFKIYLWLNINRMKKVLFCTSILLLFFSCKDSEPEVDTPPANSDLATAIIGNWNADFDGSCAYIYKEDGVYRVEDFNDCVTGCAGTPHNGTYTISGNVLTVVTPLRNFEGALEIDNNVMKITYDHDGDGTNTVFTYLKCE